MRNAIFILKESTMNGTVTMNTMVIGVPAKTFRGAVNKVKRKLVHLQCGAVSHKDDQYAFGYSINGKFPVVGTIEPTPLKMIKD